MLLTKQNVIKCCRNIPEFIIGRSMFSPAGYPVFVVIGSGSPSMWYLRILPVSSTTSSDLDASRGVEFSFLLKLRMHVEITTDSSFSQTENESIS